MTALIVWFVGGCLLGAWLADAADRRATRRLFEALAVRTINPTPPTTAELTAGIHR